LNSQFIKVAVSRLNYLLEKGDQNFEDPEIQQIGNEFILDLVNNFCKAPTTAVALVQCLTDKDFNLENLDSEIYAKFKQKFQFKHSNLSPEKVAQLRKISQNLILR
jgi:hypothetical protein